MAVVRELIRGGAAELASALCTAADNRNLEVCRPLSALLQILNLYQQVGIASRNPYLPFGTLLTLCASRVCHTTEGASPGPSFPPPVYRVIAAVYRAHNKIYL